MYGVLVALMVLLGALLAFGVVVLVVASSGGVVEFGGNWKCADGFNYRSRCGAKISHPCTKFQCETWVRGGKSS